MIEWPDHSATPGQGFLAVLIAVGIIASIHIAHHAIHYPFRQAIVVFFERWRERRKPETYIENPRWRPVPGTRHGER